MDINIFMNGPTHFQYFKHYIISFSILLSQYLGTWKNQVLLEDCLMSKKLRKNIRRSCKSFPYTETCLMTSYSKHNTLSTCYVSNRLDNAQFIIMRYCLPTKKHILKFNGGSSTLKRLIYCLLADLIFCYTTDEEDVINYQKIKELFSLG